MSFAYRKPNVRMTVFPKAFAKLVEHIAKTALRAVTVATLSKHEIVEHSHFGLLMGAICMTVNGVAHRLPFIIFMKWPAAMNRTVRLMKNLHISSISGRDDANVQKHGQQKTAAQAVLLGDLNIGRGSTMFGRPNN